MRYLAGVCGLLLSVATACSGINARSNAYNTLDEARQSGAIKNGWLPDNLPSTTRDIRVGYVPDGTERWGLFNFTPAEAAPLLRLLKNPEISLDGRRIDVPGRFEWWPVELRGELNGERLSITGLKAYETSDGQLVIAVNWNQGRAYYWNVQGRQ